MSVEFASFGITVVGIVVAVITFTFGEDLPKNVRLSIGAICGIVIIIFGLVGTFAAISDGGDIEQSGGTSSQPSSATIIVNCYSGGARADCNSILPIWGHTNLTSSTTQSKLNDWAQDCYGSLDVVQDPSGVSIIIPGTMSDRCVAGLVDITDIKSNWVGYVVSTSFGEALYSCRQSNMLRIQLYNFNPASFAIDC